MINYDFFVIIVLIYVQEVYMVLPNYVHLHTIEEIEETKCILLDKLNVCEDSQSANDSLLIAIKTAPINRDQRDILRKTWLAEAIEHQVPYIFVLGSTTDEKLLDELLIENILHNDLLIGKLVDNYYNLTLKGLFLLAWTKTYCSTKWLLYVDDDGIVNVQKAIDFVASVKNGSDRVLYCQIIRFPVDRNPESKWFVSKSIWKSDNYPDYCSGNGYLIPPNVLPLLYETLINNDTQPKLWIEDVFITGIATKAAGIKLIDSPFACCHPVGRQLFKKNIVLGQIGKGLQLLKKWKKMRKKSTPRINVRSKDIMPMSKITRFNMKRYLMTTKTYTDKKLYKFTINEQYSSLINYSFYLQIILLIAGVILLYERFSIILSAFVLL